MAAALYSHEIIELQQESLSDHYGYMKLISESAPEHDQPLGQAFLRCQVPVGLDKGSIFDPTYVHRDCAISPVTAFRMNTSEKSGRNYV
jgi:hypothetical protein